MHLFDADAEAEVTYYPGDGTTPVKKILLGIRYTDPGLSPEQPRTYPPPRTAHDRESDHLTLWSALESLDAQRIPAHPLPQGEHA